MNNIHQVLAFATAARNGSFARAARELSQTPSTIAKSIGRLEAQLGVKLFYRTTRQVSLTPDGQELFTQCQRILEEVEILKSTAAGASGTPTGVLRIEAPVTYGRRIVLPVLARLLARHRGLSVDARLSDGYSDVIREGLDAVVRIAALADSRLVARTIGRQHLLVVGSTELLERSDRPLTPHDLDRFPCVVFRNPTTGRARPWQFSVEGVDMEVHPQARLQLGDGDALIEAASAGLGLVQVPDYMAADAINTGRVVEVLRGFRAAPLPISILYPTTRMLPPRVGAFIDAMSEPGAAKLRVRSR